MPSLAKTRATTSLWEAKQIRQGSDCGPWCGEAVRISPCVLINTGWVKVPVRIPSPRGRCAVWLWQFFCDQTLLQSLKHDDV